MNEIRRPLKYSIMPGCLLFILSLCLVLNISVYMNYRNSLYDRHQAYIRDLLHFIASNMDVDDLKKCVETGEKSKHFHELQAFLDNLKGRLKTGLSQEGKIFMRQPRFISYSLQQPVEQSQPREERKENDAAGGNRKEAHKQAMLLRHARLCR